MPNMFVSRALAAFGLLFSSVAADAQVGSGAVSFGAGGASQNFDSLVSTGTGDVNNLPSGWYFRETAGTTTTTYQADDGSMNTVGNVYSYGVTGETERGFGSLATNALAGGSGTIGVTAAMVGARITNNSGSTLTALPVSYVGELWHLQQAGVDALAFEFSTDATSLTTGSWQNVAALSFATPTVVGTGKKNGNDAANRVAISGTIGGLSVVNGSDLWVRWIDANVSGNDNALAIDDVVFGVPVDEPPTLASSVPAHNATGVAVDALISVTFSEQVSVSGNWFSLNSCGGVTLTASAGPATTYTLTPSGPLPFGGLCTLFVDGSLVLDTDGTADPMAGVATIQFETEIDELPAVVSTIPLDTATDVARAANLSVTFSEPVNALAASFGIFCPDSAPASLAFALASTDATTFTLDPAADLPAGTACRLYVDNLQVTDQDGTADNPDRDTSIGFTTAALAPPSIVSTVPAKNATDFPSAGDLQVVFDTSVALAPGAFTLTCEQSTGISLSHASSGSTFGIDTGTALVAGDACTLLVEADAVTSGDGLHPDADESVPFTVAGGTVPYYAQANTSTMPLLRCSLNEIIDGHTAYPYSTTGVPPSAATDTWDILNLAEEDPVDSTKILDVYANARYTKISGGTGIYNREHTWPNTYGFSGGSPGAYTDVHMLHATNTQYNSDRGSKPFADVPACTLPDCKTLPTDANYGLGGGGGGDNNYALTNGNENNGSFEVWDHLKGNMARAMMYMVIRYEGEGGEPDLELTDTRADITSAGVGGKHYMGLLTHLIAWHQADPVDAKEVARNELVFGFQNNRNPFVDHPEWGTLALMTSSNPASCTLASGGNARPTGVDDLYAAMQNTLLTVAALDGVLDNDTDAENDALTATLIAQAIRGTVVLNANGSFTYSPNAGFCGADGFTYQASDATGTSSVTAANLNVACGGNQPPVANDATFALAENSAATTEVGTVVATDPDAGTTLAYSITAGNGSGAFAMSGNKVVVANAAPLNFEAIQQFVLTVTVSDGSLSDTAQVTINLTNVNEAPAANDATFSLAENSVATTAVGTVVASDPDAGASLTYSITAGNASGAFAMSGNQVVVANAAPLNFEATPQFVLTVTASDGTLSDPATVTINLSNVNEAPAANDATFALAENSAAATVVGTVVASDPDAGTSLSYSITAGNGSGAFAMSGNQVVVANAAPLNFEATPQFVLTVTASDGTLTDPATITVNLSNVNEAPAANDATFALAENSAAMTVVGTVVASDPDAGASLSYAITAGNASGAFAMSGNQVVVANAAPLNFEATPQFVLTVTASDGTLSDAATITVNLSNVNEAPAANDATFALAENSAAATVVGTVVASDPDAGASLSYSITAGNGSGAFAMSGNQVVVANAAPLNFEATPQFVLTVTASDGTLSDTAQITVNLSDVNEAPVAGSLADRNGEEGVALTPFSVAGGFTDPDAGADLDFSQTGLPSGVVLDAETGAISGTPVLGTAAASPYTVTITATDGQAQAQRSFSFAIAPAGTPPLLLRDGFEGN
jgi:endonuclease I/methionine-rich copper-binding protein CopC